MAYWRRLWPGIPSIVLDFSPPMMTKMSDLSSITSSLLTLVNKSANTRLFPASIHPMEGFIAAIAIVGVGLAVLR